MAVALAGSLIRLIRRLFKWGLRIFVPLVLALAAFVAWGLYWPAPSHAPLIRCPKHPPHPCVEASGRVLLSTTSHAKPHLVLFSRSSVSFPGITIAEFVDLPKMPTGTSFGDWVSVYGTQLTGSHHEQDIHVQGFATSTVVARCGWSNRLDYNVCPEHRRR